MARRIKRADRINRIEYRYRLEMDELNKKMSEAEKTGNTEEAEKLRERAKTLRICKEDEIAIAGGPRPPDW